MEKNIEKDNSLLKICDDAHFIYEHLADKESQYIFTQRVLYSMTNDLQYIHNVITTTVEGKCFSELIQKPAKLYLWGAGIWGHAIIRNWQNAWKGVIDSNSKLWGKNIYEIPIFSPEILKNSNCFDKVIITTRLYEKEIKDLLFSYGFSEDRIINVGEIINKMMDRQYFDLPQLTHAENESFVDVGSLDGSTALGFIKWSGKFTHIYSLEPDACNVKKCEKTLAPYIIDGKASIINAAAWSSKETLHFNADRNSASFVSDDGKINIKGDTLDSLLKGKTVTFIKMDIEGAELHALYGCKEIIQEQKPKLAISIYHKKQDIISLPAFILSLNPNYKLYLRHYTLANVDTVLYAIP